MSSWDSLYSDGKSSPWSILAAASRYLVLALDISELISWPDSKTSSHSEVGLEVTGIVEGIEGTSEAIGVLFTEFIRVDWKRSHFAVSLRGSGADAEGGGKSFVHGLVCYDVELGPRLAKLILRHGASVNFRLDRGRDLLERDLCEAVERLLKA